MRILVTGAGGFVGRHLIGELTSNGHEAIGLDIGKTPAWLSPSTFVTGNITEADELEKTVAKLNPDACVHLAGWAFVPSGNVAPSKILDINVVGTTNVLEAFRRAQSPARILFVSTSHVYGMRTRPAPIQEDDLLAPDTFYAISKAAADQFCQLYAKQFNLDVMVARPHNHIGPGQSPQFSIASFAKQVAEIRDGATPQMKVGNLENHRDFTDVRDIVRAYRLLLEKGSAGKAYNIASGRDVRVGDVLNRLCELAHVKPDIVRDNALYRPLDQNPTLDTRRIHTDTGWAPLIPLDQTLKDILTPI
ncbi:MAG: NAD-dependent epimerase/dehydratase family protein [bacterium]